MMRVKMLALLGFFPAAAYGNAPAPDAANRIVDELTRCRSITQSAERLDCFDRTASVFASSRAAGRLMVFDRNKVEAERRRNFGLVDRPVSDEPNAPVDVASVKTIQSTVTSVKPAAALNRWTLTLANGQTWQMLGNSRVEPRKGAEIRLSTTVTGGIRASIDGRSPVQVRRLR